MALSALALAALAAAGFALATDAPALPACASEDSLSCHWDASKQGNGLGRSFDADALGNVSYTD